MVYGKAGRVLTLNYCSCCSTILIRYFKPPLLGDLPDQAAQAGS